MYLRILLLVLVLILLTGCMNSVCSDLGGSCVDPALADVFEGGGFVEADCSSGEACLVAQLPKD